MLEVLQRITLRSEAKPDLLKRAVA
jgi:hypothetical protein